MQQRPHQKSFVDRNPNKCLVFHAPRTGKTLIAKLWAEKRPDNILVICPKKSKKNWQNTLSIATVKTKEEIKKIETPVNLSAIVIDESHTVCSELFTNKRSAIAEKVYDIVSKNLDCDILLLSGTPITNNPASLHTIMVFLQCAPTWKEYQKYMYDLVVNHFMLKKYKKRMMMWKPKKDWKERAYKILQKRAREGFVDIVTLRDCVDYLPPEIIENIEVKGEKHICTEDICHWTHDHKSEQSNKYKWLDENRFTKAVVVAHYREQVIEVSSQIAKFADVFTVHGGINNQMEVIEEWKKAPDGYLVISATMGTDFDAYMADAMIFLSLSHKVLDHTQMKERLTTLEKHLMKPKLYFYLTGGKWDKKIYESIVIAEEDFHYGEST